MSDELKPASTAVCVTVVVIATIIDLVATIAAFSGGIGAGLAFLFVGSPLLGIGLYYAGMAICMPIVYLIEKPRASPSSEPSPPSTP